MSKGSGLNNLAQLSSLTNHEILDDIQSFHQKQNYLLDKRLAQYGRFPIVASSLESFEYTDNEISPFYYESVPLKSHQSINAKRNGSNTFFSEKKVSFQDFETLLCESFAVNEKGKRPYPSGGALYPAEVIPVVISERMINSPQTGVYHFRPTLKMLQKLRTTSLDELYDSIFIEDENSLGTPSFALIYVINLAKAIVKYSYRGYRNAICEVGSMYQQADLVAKELNIKTRLSSSFSDQQMTKFLELDRQTYIPIVLHYFGY